MTVYKKLLNIICPFKALKISRELGISNNTKDCNLSSDKNDTLSKILINIKKDNMSNVIKTNINRLLKTGSLRGYRLKLGLPTRGQRTRSNAKTANLLNKKLIK